MKKRLESELISIAHRILKLKNKSEVDQLYKETQKLYETLSVLKFYQDNFESVKGDVSLPVLEEKIEQQQEAESIPEPFAEVKEEVSEPIVVEETESETEENTIVPEEIVETPETAVEEDETLDEETVEEPVFKPIFELEVEEEIEEESEEEIEPADTSNSELAKQTASEVKPETKQVSLDELLGENYVDPIFVKPSEVSLFSDDSSSSEQSNQAEVEPEKKQTTFNNTFSKSIEIGLNDRIAFVNNLFGESNEDFNRVISQLNTFDTFEEAKNFINEMVIPDYNYWVGKEEYLERFMEIVEKKFN
ncbi:hypothetical protein ACSVH2_01335 [Flavobacterium sp. RSB2_4_14]|uniref:hypothetical protein n=1 Tax=Flavobacterium sp. RSB2_4_14 TaxID=3447665 RepID=UPI003F2C0C1E